MVFRLPLPLYRGDGAGFWDIFLLLVDTGRKTGERRITVAVVLRYDLETTRQSSARLPDTARVNPL